MSDLQEVIIESNKPWQHGYTINYLKKIEALYADYNEYGASPFNEVRKNSIADNLHKEKLKVLHNDGPKAAYKIEKVKTRSKITMYLDVVIGYKEPGDYVISQVAGDCSWFIDGVNQLKGENVWLFVWAEHAFSRSLAESMGFKYVNGKITTFGEIYAVYFRDANNVLEGRTHPYVDPVEIINIKRLKYANVKKLDIDNIRKTLNTVAPNFTNHYSNYNIGRSWSAISLRGYTGDPAFITKPIEMNNKWQEENKNKTFKMQDTSLMAEFESDIFNLMIPFFDWKRNKENLLHRVRFMKLTPGGGELDRHTDIADPDSGLGLGKLARFHFPIITNPDVQFTSWDQNGTPHEKNMRVGECWVLDTRKPHKVINGGKSDRIHLVIDIQVTEAIKHLIMN